MKWRLVALAAGLVLAAGFWWFKRRQPSDDDGGGSARPAPPRRALPADPAGEAAPDMGGDALIVGRAVHLGDDGPVGGARVRAGDREAVADDSGRFSLVVRAGRHAVSALGDGVASEGSVDVTVAEGETSPELLVRLAPTVDVAGTLVRGERALAGTRVRAGIPGSERWSDWVASGPDGGFLLLGVPRGPVAFEVALHEVVAPRDLVLEESRRDLRVDVTARAGIRGRVTRGGEPASGAKVHAEGARAVAWADADGVYELSGLPAGRYVLWAASRDGAAAGRSGEIVVAEGGRAQADIALTLTGAIAGSLVDGQRAPVVGAEVRVHMAERAERGEAVTARDGSFLIGGLAGGRYLVEVSWNGAPLVLETAPADILVEDGRRASVGLVARRPAPAAAPSDAGAGLQPGAIAGTLQGFSTTPDVVAVRAGAAPVRARADRARFELARLQPGSYLVSATALGAGAFARVEVRPGETAQVALSSGAAGPLEGRVTELRTRDPVAGLRCRVAPRTGDSAAPLPYPGEVWTDAQGRYRFAAVPPGARYTMCSGAGYSDAVGDGDLVVVRQLGKLGLLGFKPDWSRIFRLEVAYIRPGQPAERAGLEVGDVVTAVDGIDVSGLGEAAVELLLRDRLPGSVARITVQRGGQARELTLTVGQWQ